MAINNQCTFTGTISDEPRVSTNPKAPVKFRMTVESDTGGKFPKKLYLTCIAWGDISDEARSLKPGAEVTVIGHMTSGSYTKQDGTKVNTTDLTVESIGAPVPF